MDEPNVEDEKEEKPVPLPIPTSPKPGPSSASQSQSLISSDAKGPSAMDQGSQDSDSYDEFESSSDEEVVFVNPLKDDYVVLPRGKGDPVPETQDLIHISRDNLAPFKELYESQPKNIKDIMKLNFYKGKPVVNPPPLSQFVKKVRALKLKRKIEKQIEREQQCPQPKTLPPSLSKKLEEKAQEKAKEKGKGKKPKESTVCLLEIKETEIQLIHVDYPAQVVHPDRALLTMGGTKNINNVFHNTNKKLPVRFRPEDFHCNAAYGQAHPTVGMLLKVTRRKPKSKTKVAKPKPKVKDEAILVDLEQEEDKLPEGYVMINGVPMSREDIINEDREILKETAFGNDLFLKQKYNIDDAENFYLKIPKEHDPKVNSKLQIESLGLIHRSYRFEGLCDLQYIPIKKSEDKIISTRGNILPIFGKSSKLFVGEDLLSGNTEIEQFLLPPMMSRVDKPVQGVIDQFMDAENVKFLPELEKIRNEDVLSTARGKRNVYTVNYNFLIDRSKNPVPTKPLPEAIEDINKRRMQGSAITQVLKCFHSRPIWSKTALEYETQLPPLTLKFVLPGVAYFASNGPWRALWIKLGFDPRDDPFTFHYQTVDFRVPFCYKQYIEEGERSDDSSYVFRPSRFPPKSQIFYQIIDLKCDEIERLSEIVVQKMGKYELKYDLKYGWLLEGTFEYIRNVLTQYVELQLEEMGKIPQQEVTKLFLKDGELEPSEVFKPRPRVIKRVRKYQGGKYKQQDDAEGTSLSEQSTKGRSKKDSRAKNKKMTPWPFQDILQDLSIKALDDGDAPIGSRDESREELEILGDIDDTLLSDASSTTTENEEDIHYDDDDEDEDVDDEEETEIGLAGEDETDDLDDESIDDLDDDDEVEDEEEEDDQI